jgi:integrase
MASIEKRTRNGQIRWYARYRDPAGKQKVKVFDRKLDAERFLTGVESTKLVGSYIDPGLARLTVGVWADRWLDGQVHLKPSTHVRYASAIREHIKPRWKDVELAKVTHGEVQAWVTDLTGLRRSVRGKNATVERKNAASTLTAATVRKTFRVFSMIMALAVKDGRLVRNPADGVNLPRVVKFERRYLTVEQVEQLADACAAAPVSKHARRDEREAYRLIVLFLAYTGLRFGEMAALRVRRLDFLRRRVVIAESVTLVPGKGMIWGTPKGHEAREVSIPRFLLEDLARHVEGKAPDDLVFPGVRSGGPLRAAVFRRGGFDDGAAAIGMPDLHPHELRHTAASVAIAAGADVKVVQQMLGHSSAAMTLDVYGHLFDDRLDTVADAMDALRSASMKTADPVGANPQKGQGDVVELAHVRRAARSN